MSDWTLNHSSDDIFRMPSLGRFRARREKLPNPAPAGRTTTSPTLYLTVAAGYAGPG